MPSKFSAGELRSQREVVEISCDPKHTVALWLSELLTKTPKANLRAVLARLVGALLRARGAPIKAKSNGSGDRVHTDGSGDFNFRRVSYHIAATPTSVQFRECRRDLAANRFPVLLLPRLRVHEAYELAERVGIRRRLTILPIESFVCHSLLLQALEQHRPMFNVWKAIIADYNYRIEITFLPAIKLK